MSDEVEIKTVKPEAAFFALAESGQEVDVESSRGACDLAFSHPIEKMTELCELAADAGWIVKKSKKAGTLCWKYGPGIQVSFQWFGIMSKCLCMIPDEDAGTVFVTWTCSIG